jgi:hypothetical protein
MARDSNGSPQEHNRHGDTDIEVEELNARTWMQQQRSTKRSATFRLFPRSSWTRVGLSIGLPLLAAILIVSLLPSARSQLFILLGRATSPTPTSLSSTSAIATSTTQLARAWALLEARPLKLPHLDAGAACPATPGREIVSSLAFVLGNSLVVVAQPGADQGQLTYFDPQRLGPSAGQWGGQSALWVAAVKYQGPVLVRGGRLDAPGMLRFNGGLEQPTIGEGTWVSAPLLSDLHLLSENTNVSWAAMGIGYTRIQDPGCYAYQVDGTTFHETIYFQAVPAS